MQRLVKKNKENPFNRWEVQTFFWYCATQIYINRKSNHLKKVIVLFCEMSERPNPPLHLRFKSVNEERTHTEVFSLWWIG